MKVASSCSLVSVRDTGGFSAMGLAQDNNGSGVRLDLNEETSFP